MPCTVSFNPGRVAPGLGFSNSVIALGQSNCCNHLPAPGNHTLKAAGKIGSSQLATKCVRAGIVRQEGERIRKIASENPALLGRQESVLRIRNEAAAALNKIHASHTGKLYGRALQELHSKTLSGKRPSWTLRRLQRYQDAQLSSPERLKEKPRPSEQDVVRLRQQNDEWRKLAQANDLGETEACSAEVQKRKGLVVDLAKKNKQIMDQKAAEEVKRYREHLSERVGTDQCFEAFKKEQKDDERVKELTQLVLQVDRKMQVERKRERELEALKEEVLYEKEQADRAKALLAAEQRERAVKRLVENHRNLVARQDNEELANQRRLAFIEERKEEEEANRQHRLAVEADNEKKRAAARAWREKVQEAELRMVKIADHYTKTTGVLVAPPPVDSAEVERARLEKALYEAELKEQEADRLRAERKKEVLKEQRATLRQQELQRQTEYEARVAANTKAARLEEAALRELNEKAKKEAIERREKAREVQAAQLKQVALNEVARQTKKINSMTESERRRNAHLLARTALRHSRSLAAAPML